MKKILVSTLSALLLMLMLTTTAFAARTTEREHIIINGTNNLVETNFIDPVTHVFTWIGDGSGQASHLGRFTDSFRVVLDPALPFGNLTYYHFVMANGDSLFSSGPAVGKDVGPNMGYVVENHTITGGTGRFAGATGSLTIGRLVTWTVIPGGIGTSSGTLTGDIILADDK